MKPGPPSVITRNEASIPAMINVAVVATSLLADDVCLTHTVCPSLIVPGTLVKLIEQPIEYSPPTTLTSTAVLMPVMVNVFETMPVESGTSVCVDSEKPSGMASQASVVTLKVRGKPAMVSIVVVVVLQLLEATCRSVTDCPGLIVPGALPNAPVSIWYSPPVTLIALPLTIPITTRVLDVLTLDIGTFTCGVKISA